MRAQFSKKSLFTKVVVFVVVTNFILTCAPVSYASIYTSDSLRIPAARGRATAQLRDDLGGVEPEADPLVLGITISLLKGAQTGGYNIKHAMDDGANGGIFNHSERRGRLEIALTNMLRGIRSIDKALEKRIEKSWADTLKTENLSDTEISATLEWLGDFQSKPRDEKAIEHLARKLVNYVINLQLKEVIAYSDEYSIAQTVLCVGETLSQYEAGRTQEVLRQDLEEILAGITQEQAKRIGLRIAYEPRWAIGTGKTPTAEQIQATHRFIKNTVKGFLGTELDVDYGGSLNEKNAAEILALKDVDGGLIGGAAKVPEKIGPVIDEAIRQGEIKGKKLNIGMNWKAEDSTTGLSPLDAFVELFRAKDLSRVQIAIGTPNVKLVRDRMTELEKEINAQRKKDVPRTRVAINGFGRIGKLVLKAFLENPDKRFEIVAVNDLDKIENLAHLFRHDSTFGEFKGEVRVEEDNLIIEGRRIKVFNEIDPTKLPWKDLGIEIVIEASGQFTKREGKEDAGKHLEAGAKKVVITAPGEDEDLTVVLGVNENKYDPEKHHVISNASCTTNCLAPVVKVLNETFGIKSGSMLTVHAATNDQRVLDTMHKDQRRARATLGNIIPTSTGAAKAIGKVIPELQGRLDGLAMRIPTDNVSAVYLDVLLKKDTTVEEVNAALKRAAEEGPLSPYLGYTEEALVSSDFLRSSKSGTVDASLTKVIDKRRVVVVIWYDNEWGYSNRTVQLVNYMLSRTVKLAEAPKVTTSVTGESPTELIQSADITVYREFSRGFDNLVIALKDLEDSRGALVIGANTIFENAATIATLRKIREANTSLKIAVWAQDERGLERLNLMGVAEVVDIMSSQGLNGVLTQLADIEKDRIALINSPLDLKNIDVLKLQEQGFRLINVKAHNAKEASLNTMPLVIARAVAGIFQNQESVVRPPYQELVKSYSESGQISAEDLKSLSDLTSQISEVPLVKVSEEIAEAQRIYEETVSKI